VLAPLVLVPRSVYTRLYAALAPLELRRDVANPPQDGPSWMIVDANKTPGGLASTDVTPEGFVSCTLL